MRPLIDPKEKSALARIRYHQTEADFYASHGQHKMQKWATEEVARWQQKLDTLQQMQRK